MKAILAFVGVAYGLAIAIGIVVGLTGGSASPYVGLGYAAMLVPAVAVVAVRLAFDEKPQVQWRRFPLVWLPAALLIAPLVMHAAMLPLTAALENGLTWSPWLTPAADGLYHTPATRNWGTIGFDGLVTRIAVNALVGLLVVSFLAFFEEIGWRAWLLPRLAVRLGARRAVVVTALIAALWHTPFALSGIHEIEGIGAAALALAAPLGHVAAALIIGWLWLKTESIWIVSFAHGALNNWGQYVFKYLDAPAPEHAAAVLGAGMAGLLIAGGALLCFGAPARKDGGLAAPMPAAER